MPNSALDALMNNLPNILLRLKENQTQQQNQERQFQFQQQQEVRRRFEVDRARDDAIAKEKAERFAQTKEDTLRIFTDLLSGEDDPTTKSKYLQLLSGADPENAGTYASIGNVYREKGLRKQENTNLLRSYVTGDIDSKDFYSKVDFDSDAYNQAVKFEKANGKEVRAYEGWITVLDPITGEKHDYRIGKEGAGSADFYETQFNVVNKWLKSDEAEVFPELREQYQKEADHYGRLLEELGVDIYGID